MGVFIWILSFCARSLIFTKHLRVAFVGGKGTSDDSTSEPVWPNPDRTPTWLNCLADKHGGYELKHENLKGRREATYLRLGMMLGSLISVTLINGVKIRDKRE